MTDKKKIEVEAVLQKLQTLADGSTRVIFDLQEDKEASMRMLEQIHQIGRLTFEPEG